MVRINDAARIRQVRYPGRRGSEVKAKRLPPSNQGTRIPVDGILKVELPRLGIKITRSKPAKSTSSGVKLEMNPSLKAVTISISSTSLLGENHLE